MPTPQSKSSPRDKKPVKPAAPLGFWVRHQTTLIALFGLYLLIAAFFSPIVLRRMALSTSPDMIAASGMVNVAEKEMAEGSFPLWNPTLFTGMPMFASLQYALFVYPPEFIIRILSYIFGFGGYRVWLFHYLLAGIFTWLLARHLGAGRVAAWIAGAAYAFSPQLIVLTDVGHGSKLMGMVYLPLIWLLLDRLRLRPNMGRAAALGAVYAVEILSLHPQVAAYGGLMMGLFVIYYGVDAALKKAWKSLLKFTVLWFGSLAVSLALSAVLWLSVLDYARYSIRGMGASGIAGGGVTWDYATGWSFAPIESLTYLFPYFFGFVYPTYWGTVGYPDGTPFTQNPMYFGVLILTLAALSLFFLPRRKWGFPITLGVLAWILSFGRYLPILYGPLFHLLPLFNKFRAPVMGQVLLLLPMAVLAGLGMQALLDKTQTAFKPVRSGVLMRSFTIGALRNFTIGVAILTIIVLMASSPLKEAYADFVRSFRPKMDIQAVKDATAMALPDIARGLALITATLFIALLLLLRKIPAVVFSAVAVIILLVDLWPINHKLVSYTSESSLQTLFKPEKVIGFLSQDKDKFRVHPLDQNYPALYWQRELRMQTNVNPSNWLGYFGIEATTGYFGAKPAAYQQFMTQAGLEAGAPYSWMILLTRPELLDALNVKYLLTTVPLHTIYEEMSRQTGLTAARPESDYLLAFTPRNVRPGGGAFIYENRGVLPRARLVGGYRVISDLDSTFQTILQGDWNPRQETLLDRSPQLQPQPGGDCEAQITSYHAREVAIKVVSDVPKLLVLADQYYPSGWTATIDRRETPILRADGVMRAVEIGAGDHQIVFKFHPKWFYIGLYISLTTIVFLAVGVGISLKKRLTA
ncbi:MAG: YfhO family protein [Calditrichota bacterium]